LKKFDFPTKGKCFQEEVKFDEEVEEKLKEENEEYWSLFDTLVKNCKKADFVKMLDANNQDSKGAFQKVLLKCCDRMIFGCLPKCPMCKESLLTYASDTQEYKCIGFASAWSRCQYRAFYQNLTREIFKIPQDLQKKFKFLKAWQETHTEPRVYVLRPDRTIPEEKEKKKRPKKKARNNTTASNPKTITLKDGQAVDVDPKSGLASTCHIFSDSDTFNITLSLSDITYGTNSYYRIQLLETNTAPKQWFVWRKWGRVGSHVGGGKKDEFSNLNKAKALFKKTFYEKTGNKWNNRKNFVKKSGKYYPLDLDQEDDELIAKAKEVSESTQGCDLAPPVQDLVRLLFDIDAMQSTLLEMEVDMKKMPLGKLSKQHILAGYSILEELQQIINARKERQMDIADDDQSGKGKEKEEEMKEEYEYQKGLLDNSNKFYSHIPHVSRRYSKLPLLDSDELIKEKMDMLEALLDLEIAVKLLKQHNEGNPIQSNYEKLQTQIEVVPEDSEEFEIISKYITCTHAPTHSNFSLEIANVFKIERAGERLLFENHIETNPHLLNNRMLLWHGSRLTNFVGILSQGLRIAPPEAPVTGYMFGKGVYFADMVSKSANYCRTTPDHNTGLMLLAEVALGKTYKLKQSMYMDKPPMGCDSTKGCGGTVPRKSGSVEIEDGLVVPCGAYHSKSNYDSSLLYNEYIVYNTDQILLKYLIQLRFIFN